MKITRVKAVLVTDKSMSDTAVAAVVKAILDNFDEYKNLHPALGKAPTDRMSLNLAMSSKTWERYVWDRLKSFNLKKDYPQRPYIRGVFDTKKFNENFADGAVPGAVKLGLLGTKQIEIKMNRGEMIASVSYDEKNQEFAFTSSYAGSYFTKDFKNFDKFAVLDYQNSWNLGHTTASAFVGEDLLVIGQNKTAYGLKRLKEPMDKVIEYRTFLQTSGDYGSYFEKGRKYCRSNFTNNKIKKSF